MAMVATVAIATIVFLGFKRRHFSLCGAPAGFERLSGTSVHESMPLFSSGIDYSEIGSPSSQSCQTFSESLLVPKTYNRCSTSLDSPSLFIYM